MMSSVPEANAGVGGALNEVARVVGIALGVSVLGSIANSVFASQVRDGTSSLGASGDGHEDSIGAATQIAAQIGGPTGDALRSAAEARSSTRSASRVGRRRNRGCRRAGRPSLDAGSRCRPETKRSTEEMLRQDWMRVSGPSEGGANGDREERR